MISQGRLRAAAVAIGLACAASLAWLQPVAAPGGAAAQRLDVPYEPSPDAVVRAMLDVAQVGPNDVVYDLGSGDGRVVIAAARLYGARGVGVDLDPQRIAEAQENARRAGVTDRVTFIQGDLFKADLTPATVITMFLWPDVNMRLRPTLMSLAPGTRIVSHWHNLGDWQPQQTLQVRVPQRTHAVYYWVVPPKQSARE